ncbi:protein LSM14 homolog B-B-like [Oscarella lobularis]|uniref:protein LSM14 homolog B-B-like n=1 Tax=Oscarella lobularis TaxID=121494 RepID=UPI0033143907
MSSLSDRVGSRISVISKSQERFDGVLHQIDPNAKTVTLSEVKFHGTENRFVVEGHPTVLVKYAVFDKADLVVFQPLSEKTSKTPEVVFPRKSAPLATQHRSHVSRYRYPIAVELV